ncbi:MAG: rod shape-determining protein MreC [Candidatus Eisenbacteria bacterium]|nr:rod shape-determining protein MreC [Candidatus Eisenbacteria bacterium]
MASRGALRASRRSFLLWIACAGISILLLASPVSVRRGIATGLEWSFFFPVRSVLGWEGRSLLVQMQNRKLSRDLTAERLEVAQLAEKGRENETLRRMLGMRARTDLALLPARVVGRSLDWTGEVLWLEVAGSAQTGTAVVTPDGLLGRVARSGGARALAETVWHSRVAVSVMNRRSGEQGILRWNPEHPGELAIEPVPLQSDFRKGDPIVTSGLGEVFPRGILVGHVVGAEEDRRTQLKRVRVQGAVRRGRAYQVFLVEERPPEGDASGLYPEPSRVPPGPPPMPGAVGPGP